MITLFFTAFLQVFLVALNVVHISTGRYAWAFLTGFAISWVWWLNAHSAAHEAGMLPQLVYAAGAGCGTISGMAIGALLSPSKRA